MNVYRPNRFTNRQDTGMPRSNTRAGDKIRPLIWEEGLFGRICLSLGPLPSERSELDPRSSRDRLSSESSVGTGMRVDEVANVTVLQVLALPVDVDPEGFTVMHIKKTKGLVERDILWPNFVIPELHGYIDGERNECLAAARRYWLKNKKDEPVNLFLNREDAGRNAGRPATADTLSGAFSTAVVAAGIVEQVQKIDPDSGHVYYSPCPRHSFHDLRHSFAVLTYHALVELGISEPWKIIQDLLGHRNLATTIETYLRVVNVEKARVADAMYRTIRKRIRGN
jgi:integrase/recombinase XerC